MFNLQTRSLVLPNWEFEDEDFTKMLVAHEVAHAIYTPAKEWMAAIRNISQDSWEQGLFKNIVNIIEDCRIDRLIQERYVGLKYNYYHSSKYLMKADFFGLKQKGKQPHELDFLDRINIYFKSRFYTDGPYDCQFTADEMEYVRRIEKLMTFDDVLEISKELFDKFKDEIKTKSFEEFSDEEAEGEEGEGEGDGKPGKGKGKGKAKAGQGEGDDEGDGNGMPDRMTIDDDMLNKAAQGKAGEKGGGVHLPSLGGTQGQLLKNIQKNIVKMPNIARNYSWGGGNKTFVVKRVKTADVTFKNWNKGNVQSEENAKAILRKWNTYITAFCSSFERKKNARNFQASRIDKTGMINVNKLFEYAYSEDIFLSKMVENYQKNHGFLFLLDCSGSMDTIFPKVAEQFTVLTEIARRLGVPCRGYGFSDHYRLKGTQPNFSGQNVSLIDLYDYKDSMRVNLQKLGSLITGNIVLNGTPLGDSLAYMLSVADQFKEETKIDVLNMIVLTDGGDGTGHYYPTLQDGKTRALTMGGKSTRETQDNTHGMYQMIRDVTGANIIHVDVTDSPTKGSSEFKSQKFTLQKDFGGASSVLYISPSMINPTERKIIETFTSILK